MYFDPEIWTNLVQKTREGVGHYFAQTEQTLLEDASPAIADIIREIEEKEHRESGVAMLVEWGPGTGEKVLPVLKAMKSVKKVVFFDKQKAFTAAAQRNVEKTLANVSVNTQEQDFSQKTVIYAFNASAMAVELGATIFNIEGHPSSNFPAAVLTERLKNLCINSDRSSWLLISQHLGNGPEDLLRCYEGKHIEDFVRSPLHLVKRVFNIREMDPDTDFVYRPVFISGSHLFAHYMQSTVRKTYGMNDGTKHYITESTKNSPINSYKPPEDIFLDCAARAGLEKVTTFYDQDYVMAIHLLRRQPVIERAADVYTSPDPS